MAGIVADFNGDGKSDSATITAASGSISTAHGGGTIRDGVLANWLTISAVGTNAVAGQEFVATYIGGVEWIVDDRTKKTRLYNVAVGDEIMFSYVDGRSYVVDDRLHATRAYFHLSDCGPPSCANVDGIAGLEAIFHCTSGQIWVVDRTRKVPYR